ncbi:ornithine cyclodeaminase family protein [Phaeovulum sp.]|uniref:ornithine cyclodeaminase family protein n=1 Tax=Phaeovulum sp. TaxID=2934796 RepID=UPI002730D674|nr:NAD(P)-binding domain-containing protein [Phaeovulum sp.]MDP1668901.1 NAD(P)-binding domain-containing protein [Phaeovulum sp.]MDZ4119172.1 NAD(P)-binding domain-containing protein [Phaeovulum sp.]
MSVEIIGPEAEAHLDWLALTDALAAGHALPRAEVADTFLYRGKDTLLTRSAWISGLGLAVKAASIFPGNPAAGVPMVNGAVTLYDDATGRLEAIVDFHLVTKWKTAGDSLLAARRLARPQARRILIVGAGQVARSMIAAYSAAFPAASFTLWNRSPEAARALAAATGGTATEDLEAATRNAEIIATTTMSSVPLIKGEWLSPGTHLDLIGAYRPDMREVDDTALTRASLFVDARATTIAHIGELKDPIARGVITPASIRADFYDLASGGFARSNADEITLCKNGGGAHLDLICAQYILAAWRKR